VPSPHAPLLLHNNVSNSINRNCKAYDKKEKQISLDKLANNNSVYANNISGGQ